MHTRPSSTHNDEFNTSQNNKEERQLIMGKQEQRLETSKEQREPTGTANSNIQQLLTSFTDQATLAGLPRRDPSPWDDVEGRFGISTHAPSCNGPRILLEVIGGRLKSESKVASRQVSTTAAA